MIKVHHVKKGSRLIIVLFLASLIIFSLLGAYFGTRGNRVDVSRYPTVSYEEVTFSSAYKDQLRLTGWYFPGTSETVTILVHGWGGNRARLLDLAEYLNKNGLTVLTFDVRGGTGKNTYGQREAHDIAGAVKWLEKEKKIPSSLINIVGVSMGGAATVSYAVEHPVKKLVLVSPVIDIYQVKYKILQDRYILFPKLYATGATFVERVIYGVRPLNPIDHFEKIPAPTLILHGEKDELSPVSTVRALEDRIKDKKLDTDFIYVPSGQHTFLDLDKSNGYPYSKNILYFLQN